MTVLRRFQFTLTHVIGIIGLVASVIALVLAARFVNMEGDVHCVQFAPSGAVLAAGSEDGVIRIWDTGSGHYRSLTGHTNLVRSLAFSPDGATLASSGLDMRVILWDVATGLPRAILRSHTAANCVAFSPDGRLLAAGDWANTTLVWSVESQSIVANLSGHQAAVTSVSFSPDGNTLLSGSTDGTVTIWDVESWSPRGSILAGDAVMSVAFSPGGESIAIATENAGIKLWDSTGTRELSVLHSLPQRLTSLAFSPDGKMLAAASATELIHTIFPGNVRFRRSQRAEPFVGVTLWEVPSGRERARFSSSTTVWSVTFSGDGRLLAGGSEGWVTRVWSVAAAREQFKLTARTPVRRLILYLAGAACAVWLLARGRRSIPQTPKSN